MRVRSPLCVYVCVHVYTPGVCVCAEFLYLKQNGFHQLCSLRAKLFRIPQARPGHLARPGDLRQGLEPYSMRNGEEWEAAPNLTICP